MALASLPLPTGTITLVDEDDRRAITEVVLDLPGGGICRIGTITVNPDLDGTVRLGDHRHPGTESFLVLDGGADLYLAHADAPEDITVQRLTAGETVVIPAGVIHTFVCEPGTVLQSIAHAPFDDSWIVPRKLNLPVNG